MYLKKTLLLLIASLFLSAADQKSKGLVLYLDGMPGSVQTELAKELAKSPHFVYLSSKDYAEQHNERRYKSAVLMFKEAITRAEAGEKVVLDSFIVREYFLQKDSPNFDIVTVAVWCPLSCLKENYDKEAQEKEAYKKSSLVKDFNLRYPEKSSEQIMKDKGRYYYNDKFIMKYDLFLNTENKTIPELSQIVFDSIKNSDSHKNSAPAK